MFKRREKKSYREMLVEPIYPRKGWRRGMDYMRHRLKRLPDTPHKISMGIACGVFVTFTPLFGLHFFAAWFLALVLRGNVFAALLGTFVGNPLTFPFIAAISYQLGLRMLGRAHDVTVWSKILASFDHAFDTLWGNVKSLFGYEKSTWDGLLEFSEEVFVPYFIGGIIPGLITATICYFLTKPLIARYQKRRKLRIRLRRTRKANRQKIKLNKL